MSFYEDWGRDGLVFVILGDFPESDMGSDIGIEIDRIKLISDFKPFLEVG